MTQQVQFNIDSHFNEDARYRKVLFGYDGQLLEVELNELQDIMNARLSEVVDNVFGSRPLYAGTYTVSGSVLTIANEVVVANRELILLTSSSITVANGDTIYLNIQDLTKAYTDPIKKYGDQNSNTTVTNYMQDSRVGQETTRRVQVTFQLVKTNTNPGTNIQLCTINSSGAVVLGSPDSFADSNLYKEIRRLADEEISSKNLQALKNVFGTVTAGGTSVTATTTADTLALAPGTAVTLAGNASTKTVTISVPNATTSADGSMSSADKTKLNGIASGAQVNQNAFANASAGGTTLAATTTGDTLTFAASGAVTVAGSGKTVTVGMPNATTSADGSMSSGDKTKLNGVATGAEVNQNAWTNVTAGGTTVAATTKTDTLALAAGTAVSLAGNASTKTVTINVPNATTSADGSMSSADKTKLNGIATGAQVNQNAFATVTAGGTNLAATTTSDTITISGSGAVTVTGSGKTATIGANAASTTVVGVVQLTDSTASTSTTTAATPNSVKTTYDLANGKYAKPGTGIPKTDLETAVQASLGKADTAVQSLPSASTTVAGIVQLTDGYSSTSTTTAATANAANAAYNAAVNWAKGYSVGTTPATSDNSTNAASTAFVKAQGYITGNQSITISGDASGTGATAITLTLGSVGTAGTYTKVTTDSKGRVTSGTTLSTSDLPNYGAANGVASTDSNGNVPLSQLGNVPPSNLLTNPMFWIN